MSNKEWISQTAAGTGLSSTRQMDIDEKPKSGTVVALDRNQVRKGIAITVCFVLLRLISARLWDSWFNMEYHLDIPFLAFLFSIFLVISIGLVYFGFTRWVGVDLKPWWVKQGRIKGDILWGIGTLIVGGFVVLGVGILMMSLNVFPQSLMAAPAPGESIEQSLAQIPIDLLLGWFFGFAIAAFCEETIFRGFLQEQISRKCSPWVGNLLQALIFSVTHFGMAPLGTLGYEVFQLVFRFGSGLVFGWLKMKRGTLLACGIVHGFIG